MSTARRLALLVVLILALVLQPAWIPPAASQSVAPPSQLSEQEQAPTIAEPVAAPAVSGDDPVNALSEALRLGKWPAQTVGATGDVRPDVHGPQRTDPAEGIPVHAYSPFDERANREYPCPPGGCEFVKGQVLVKLAEDVSVAKGAGPAMVANDALLSSALSANSVTALEPIFPDARPPMVGAMAITPDGEAVPVPDLTRWYRATLSDASADVTATAESLSDTPGIALAEPDYLRKPVGDERRTTNDETPDIEAWPSSSVLRPSSVSTFTDPLYTQQWHLAATHVPEAWQWLSDHGLPPGGSRDVVVAVIDTGVDLTHPDLAANLWTNSREIPGNNIDDDGNGFKDDVHGVNVVGNTSSHTGNPTDDHGHGTHVAGIIAAQAGNGIGGVGVAYNTQIMAIKAAQYSGVLAASDIAEGIYYAVAQGADVINMSFGGYARSQLEEDALAVAFGQTVLVAAAGNDGLSAERKPCGSYKPMYPAAYNWVLGVMASTQANTRASFSNYDPFPHTCFEYEVLAPGVDVWSTLPNSQYAAWDGTSMAAPVVSGIAALARTKWNDKDLYSSRFIMGQIAANTTGGTSGVSNASAALITAPQPELSYLQHWLFDTTAQAAGNDHDGIVDAGETVDLAIVIRNHWGKADPVSVELEARAEDAFQPDPYVTMLTDTVDYGAIGSFNQDDNGLIYDAQGTITGVSHPFRFSVASNTPNDHVIPFRLTMTASNGYDPNSAPLTFVSHFNLLVQRGRELPRVISQDMTLTKDDYWLVPDQTLIEAGVQVIITEGTQLQFWSADPSDPYANQAHPFIQVEGKLKVQGTETEPVEMFPGVLYPEYAVQITGAGTASNIDMTYAKIMNPKLGHTGGDARLENLDHCYFSMESSRVLWREPGSSNTSTTNPNVEALQVASSIYHKVNGVGTASYDQNNLFDSSVAYPNSSQGIGSVFLNCASSMGYGTGYQVYRPVFLRNIFPIQYGANTYLTLSPRRGNSSTFALEDAEIFANFLNGHVVTVNDAAENSFLGSYQSQQETESAFRVSYPNMTCGVVDCWSLFRGNRVIGLTDGSMEGVFSWISGEPVGFTNWEAGYPGGTTDYGDYVTLATGPDPKWRVGSLGNESPFVLELPGVRTQGEIDAARTTFVDAFKPSTFKGNAILNPWWNLDLSKWLKFTAVSWLTDPRNWSFYIKENYWGTTSRTLIDAAIHDYQDDFNLGQYVYEPILTTPPETAYPFVADVVLSTQSDTDASIVGAEPVTFIVTFNRNMDLTVQPVVSFGPDVPLTDYTVHPINGGWTDARTWQGTFNITPVTGDGYQLIRVAGAHAADDPWLVTGDDAGRFRFEIITSGTESMNLQATGSEGRVNLTWTQNDFDLLAGFNLYRATSQTGTYSRINTSIIPPQTRAYADTAVTPGQPYYYKFTVVKSDMTESDFSNVAQGTPLDTIPPVLAHTPVTSAVSGLALTLAADATDNVAVQSVTLYFRAIGGTTYTARTMTRTTGNHFSATLEGSRVTSPGIEYYIEATDGISTVRSGRPEYPHQVVVTDKPTVTAVTPNRGPAGGGGAVTIAGSNFKAGATVTFGGAAADSVTVVSSSQVTCMTPAHYPAAVDVVVTNPGGATGTLPRGFTFESTTAFLSLPATGGEQHAIVQIPINAANVQGLAAADIKVTFNSAVLSARGAHTGSLTPGWSITPNTATAGEIRLAMASPGGTVTGAGTLALLEFEVVGAAGSSSPLTLASASLNAGAIPTDLADGSFSVATAYSIAGTVRFWQDSSPVPGVQLTLAGARLYTGLSAADGVYSITGVPAGDYTLTPAKADDVRGITAYDAALALQHAAGLITLTGAAFTAGDVDKDAAITSMDAFYILQKSVDLIALPFPGAGAVWGFTPANLTFTGLNSNRSDQNFAAVLLGDVSGNWASGGGALTASLQADATATLSLSEAIIPPGVEVTLDVKLAGGVTDARGLDLAVSYDPAVIQFVRAERGDLPANWSLAHNAQPAGAVKIGVAGAGSISGGATLARLTFRAIGVKGQSSTLTFGTGLINEGGIAVTTQAGRITVDTPPVTDLKCQKAGGAQLTWTHVGSDVQHYEVWRAENNPYFVPGQSGVRIADNISPSATSFTDTAGGLGNSTINSFYAVVSVDADGRPSPVIMRVGEFDFLLAPGSGQ